MAEHILTGIHHVSAITADAPNNYAFYTNILGMRLVKKTVNQDDTSVYHLFYADERGNPGTDLTFFEIPNAGQTRYGTNSISSTSLRVPNDQSLDYWQNRLIQYGIHPDPINTDSGRASLSFRDFEGQRLTLVSDEYNSGVPGGKPWDRSPVPVEHGIYGLGPVHLTVANIERTATVLTEILRFRNTRTYSANIGDTEMEVSVFETGEGGSGAELHVNEQANMDNERLGRGGVHHVALRVENESQLREWVNVLNGYSIPNSGFVERYYFRSLYFREPNGILFELATDGPGFEGDEPFETLGERLSLPPYLEDQRNEIEGKLKRLDTRIPNKGGE